MEGEDDDDVVDAVNDCRTSRMLFGPDGVPSAEASIQPEGSGAVISDVAAAAMGS